MANHVIDAVIKHLKQVQKRRLSAVDMVQVLEDTAAALEREAGEYADAAEDEMLADTANERDYCREYQAWHSCGDI